MAHALARMNLSKAHLLLVDDNEQSMEVLTSVLLGLGVKHMHTSPSAADARRVMVEAPFDLMLVDQDMPGEDGLAFCRAMRNDPAGLNYTTPFILLTTLPSRDNVLRARDAGAHYVIAKPASPAVLLQRIERIARSRRSFVTSDTYHGPDRRFQILALPAGMEERRQDVLRLIEKPERALSQDHINALFD